MLPLYPRPVEPRPAEDSSPTGAPGAAIETSSHWEDLPPRYGRVRSLEGPAQAVSLFAALQILLAGATILVCLQFSGMEVNSHQQGSGAALHGQAGMFDNIVRAIWLLEWGVLGALLVSLMFWVSRAVRNVPTLGGGKLFPGPLASAGLLLVPVINVFWLMSLVQRLLSASDPWELTHTGRKAGSTLWSIWCTAWILSIFSEIVLFLTRGELFPSREVLIGTAFSLAFKILTLALLMGVIRQVTHLQAQRNDLFSGAPPAIDTRKAEAVQREQQNEDFFAQLAGQDLPAVETDVRPPDPRG